MILLGFILYFISTYSSGSAAPVTTSLKLTHDPSSFLPRDVDSADLCPRQRLEVIWSCLATLLASSWVSVHPNLPHPHESGMKRTLRRIELMQWAIISPELIIFWAMRQWLGARKMEREFLAYSREKKTNFSNGPRASRSEPNPHVIEIDSRAALDLSLGETVAVDCNKSFSNTHEIQKDGFTWTRTHGFFLQMGGFVLHEHGKPKRLLGWKTLMQYYKDGRIDLSDVTEAKIKDQSKADGLAKGLALLQTCWFIVQCIARFSDRNLALTEIELVTAALAVLSLVMYFLWWNKPFNAQVPIVITLSKLQSNVPTSRCNQDSQEDVPAIFLPDSHNEIPKAKPHLISVLSSILWIFKHTWKRLYHVIDDGAYHCVTDPIDDPENPVLKAPTFYSIKVDYDIQSFQMLCASLSIATVFGAIHCIGWSDRILFSSQRVSLLWKSSSAIITATPLNGIAAFGFGYLYKTAKVGSLSKTVYHVKILTDFD